MESIIAACGNDCSVCPRHMDKTEEELRNTAVLWFEIGYRDRIVSNDEIKCYGCTVDNWCRYKINDCVNEKNIQNCGQCEEYSCKKISEAFEKTMEFEPQCKSCCNSEQYEVMKKAFFEKKKNLDKFSIEK